MSGNSGVKAIYACIKPLCWFEDTSGIYSGNLRLSAVGPDGAELRELSGGLLAGEYKRVDSAFLTWVEEMILRALDRCDNLFEQSDLAKNISETIMFYYEVRDAADRIGIAAASDRDKKVETPRRAISAGPHSKHQRART